MTNTCRAACVLLLIGLLLGATGSRVTAQAVQPALATTSEIHADSKPYHMEWNGVTGSFSQDALGVETARKMPLVFLHSDAGPKGYAKYTAWFLVRDGQAFSLLWCYLNDSGTEYSGWLYSYPANLWSLVRFTGNYRFSPPAERSLPLSPPISERPTCRTIPGRTLPLRTGPVAPARLPNWTCCPRPPLPLPGR